MQELPFINTIEVPSFVEIVPNMMFDINGFADASQRAYGCCIYVRVPNQKGFQSILLIAKSKVAPVVQQLRGRKLDTNSRFTIIVQFLGRILKIF